MTKLLIALTLLTSVARADLGCAGYQAEGREYKASLLNAAAANVGPIHFPSNMEVLFRGAYEANPQFDLKSSIEGMLGERNWYVGSPMFFGIHDVLVGHRTLESDFFPTGGLPYKMYKYFSVRNILSDMTTLLKCRAPKFYSNDEANLIAADLMNKAFFAVPRAVVLPRFFNIQDPNYYAAEPNALGFANNAVDFIIGSNYDQVASIYGIKTLVLKDKRNRGFDLGWWNKVNNGAFWQSWVDNGEIDIPGYITSDEILGFQQRTVDRARTGWGQGVIENGVQFAYYKVGQQVAIIDGASDACIIQGHDSRFYSCERNWAAVTTEPVTFPVPHAENMSARKALIGLICAGECETSLFKTYGKYSARALPAAVIAQIASMKVNGVQLKLALAKDSADAKTQFDGIKIISATFAMAADALRLKGNVTKKAAAFADGKNTVDYKVSGRFLAIPEDGKKRIFTIDYVCGNKPNAAKHLSEPAPSEGKILKLVCD